MNITQILISGIIASLAVGLGRLVGRKLIPDHDPKHTSKRTAVTVTLVGLAIALSQAFFYYSNHSASIQNQATHAIETTPGMEIFQAIRHADPVEYKRLMDQLVQLAQNKDPNARAKAIQLTRETTGRYFDLASDEAVIEYLKAYTAALRALAEVDPLFVCNLENPQVYGPANAAQLTQLARFPLAKAMEDVVRSSLLTTQSVTPEQRVAALQDFAAQYQIKHPEQWGLITSQLKVFTQPELQVRARAFVHFYETLANGPVAKNASVYRQLHK
jgi:hypothetical protein